VGRRHLNNWAFGNDPDVFIIREKNQKMPLKERKVLLYLNMLLGDLVFTSDHVGEYSKDEMELYMDAIDLRDANVIKVVEDEIIYIEAEVKGKKVLYIFNLSDKEKAIGIPDSIKENYTSQHEKTIGPRDMRVLN